MGYKVNQVHGPVLSASFDNFSPAWLVPSKQPVNPPEERLPVSSWPPKLPENPLPPPEESRSPIVTGPEQSPSGRSGDTRSPPSCSSVNSPSRGSSGRSPRTSKLISGSRALPSELSRRPAKLTWWVCSRIPTCALSIQEGDHYAQGYPAGSPYPWRTRLSPTTGQRALGPPWKRAPFGRLQSYNNFETFPAQLKQLFFFDPTFRI